MTYHWLPNLGYLLLFAFALGIWTGLLLSRLEDRRVNRRGERYFPRLLLAWPYYRQLHLSWRVAWIKAGTIRRGEWC